MKTQLPTFSIKLSLIQIHRLKKYIMVKNIKHVLTLKITIYVLRSILIYQYHNDKLITFIKKRKKETQTCRF